MQITVYHMRHPRRHMPLGPESIVPVSIEEKGSWESLFPCMTPEEIVFELKARWVHSSIDIRLIQSISTFSYTDEPFRKLTSYDFANNNQCTHIKVGVYGSGTDESAVVTERKLLAWRQLFGAMNIYQVLDCINKTWIDPLYVLHAEEFTSTHLHVREESQCVS